MIDPDSQGKIHCASQRNQEHNTNINIYIMTTNYSEGEGQKTKQVPFETILMERARRSSVTLQLEKEMNDTRVYTGVSAESAEKERLRRMEDPPMDSEEVTQLNEEVLRKEAVRKATEAMDGERIKRMGESVAIDAAAAGERRRSVVEVEAMEECERSRRMSQPFTSPEELKGLNSEILAALTVEPVSVVQNPELVEAMEAERIRRMEEAVSLPETIADINTEIAQLHNVKVAKEARTRGLAERLSGSAALEAASVGERRSSIVEVKALADLEQARRVDSKEAVSLEESLLHVVGDELDSVFVAQERQAAQKYALEASEMERYRRQTVEEASLAKEEFERIEAAKLADALMDAEKVDRINYEKVRVAAEEAASIVSKANSLQALHAAEETERAARLSAQSSRFSVSGRPLSN